MLRRFQTSKKKPNPGPAAWVVTFQLRSSAFAFKHQSDTTGPKLAPAKPRFYTFLALITSAKVISYAISVGAFGSCAIAVSNIFAAFLQAAAQFPGRQDDLWTFTLIGVALVETFFFVTILIIVLIFTAQSAVTNR